MLHHLTQLYGRKLGASDGELGHVKDVYFDDTRWSVRFLVAETGSWFSGRKVLLPPHALGAFHEGNRVLRVKLAHADIENSPPIESHRPVSRQYETKYFHYYGWPVYWVGDGFGGLGGFPGVVHVPSEQKTRSDRKRPDDIHLRSTRAIAGYQVRALDGSVGHVRDFAVDDATWSVRELIVAAGRWFSGKEIRISPTDVERISFQQSTVFVALTKSDIERTGDNALATAGAIDLKALGLEE